MLLKTTGFGVLDVARFTMRSKRVTSSTGRPVETFTLFFLEVRRRIRLSGFQ